jgi:hypothetical protein
MVRVVITGVTPIPPVTPGGEEMVLVSYTIEDTVPRFGTITMRMSDYKKGAAFVQEQIKKQVGLEKGVVGAAFEV